MRTLTRIAIFTIFALFANAFGLAQDSGTVRTITFPPVESVQEKQSNDAVKFGVGFSNSEYEDLFSTEYEQGLYGEVDVKAYRRGPVRLGIVGRYDRNRFRSPSVDTYSGGGRLSVDLAKGFVSPFGHALFGVTTTYNDDRVFTRTYGAGVDLNFGHFYLRPIEVNWIRNEGAFSPATQRFNVGLGARF